MPSASVIPFPSPAISGPTPLRVCDLVQFHSPISGGVKRFIEDKCRFLARDPAVEHLVIVPGPAHSVDVWARSTVHVVQSPRLVGSASYRVLHDGQRIAEIIARFRPHVIEVGDPYLTAWIGRRVARDYGARLVGFYHSDYPRAWYRTVQRFAGRAAGTAFERVVTAYLRRLYGGMDALVVASTRLERTWQERGLGDRLRLIPLGVDTTVFRPVPEQRAHVRSAWGVPADAPVLLFVGRLAREKRIDWLVRSHRRLLQQVPDLRLVFIGDGEWRPAIQRWAQEEPRLHWQPYVKSSEALAAAYSAGDVFVHAGLNETFGLSVLEAQACGLPVVACRDSGMDETVLRLPGNACVPASDEPAWDQAVVAALRLRAGPLEAQQRFAAVQQGFPSQRTYERLGHLYRELGRRGPPAALPPAERSAG